MSCVAQGHKQATVNVPSAGLIPTRGNYSCNILISSLRYKGKMQRCIPPLNTQCFENWAVPGEWSVLRLDSSYLPCYKHKKLYIITLRGNRTNNQRAHKKTLCHYATTICSYSWVGKGKVRYNYKKNCIFKIIQEILVYYLKKDWHLQSKPVIKITYYGKKGNLRTTLCLVARCWSFSCYLKLLSLKQWI